MEANITNHGNNSNSELLTQPFMQHSIHSFDHMDNSTLSQRMLKVLHKNILKESPCSHIHHSSLTIHHCITKENRILLSGIRIAYTLKQTNW